MRIYDKVVLLPLLGGLAGCNMVTIDPSGDVAVQQRDLILLATGLMLLIVLPVIALTLGFAWNYRASNVKAAYAPDWSHSTRLEMAVWAAPLAIIAILGTVTWITSHTLDPYRPLDRLGPDRPVSTGVKPLEIDVVALDWKWLFIYPEFGIASVNEVAAPVDRPLDFRITASTVMNSFYIPALAGQVYAMPGMQTRLHAVINRPGLFDGISANYSGEGFSDMHFAFRGMRTADFTGWVARLRSSGAPRLTRVDYLQLEKPSVHEPPRHYRAVEPGLFQNIVSRCVEPGQSCMVMRNDRTARSIPTMKGE